MDATKKRGRKSADEISMQVPWILRNLDELELLEECPIATLTSVRRLAETSYADSMFPSGMAIRTLIFESIESICADLEHLPAYRRECQFLKSVANGSTVAEFSRSLGLSREHVARTVQQRAVKLLTRAFLARAHEADRK